MNLTKIVTIDFDKDEISLICKEELSYTFQSHLIYGSITSSLETFLTIITELDQHQSEIWYKQLPIYYKVRGRICDKLAHQGLYVQSSYENEMKTVVIYYKDKEEIKIEKKWNVV